MPIPRHRYRWNPGKWHQEKRLCPQNKPGHYTESYSKLNPSSAGRAELGFNPEHRGISH